MIVVDIDPDIIRNIISFLYEDEEIGRDWGCNWQKEIAELNKVLDIING